MKIRKTLKDNIKITLSQDEAEALFRLIDTSDAAIEHGGYTEADERLIGWPLFRGLKDAGAAT